MSAKAINATICYKVKQDIETEAYREYMARCARLCTENMAKISGGSYITAEFADIVNPRAKDNRKPEEIVADIIEKAGIEVI